MTRVDPDTLVRKSLPTDVVDKWTEALFGESSRQIRRFAPRLLDARVAAEWREDIRRSLRIPASLLPRLTKEARRRIAAGERAAEITLALDAIVEPVLSANAERLMKRIPKLMEQMTGELALREEAAKLHRSVLRSWRYAHERADEFVAFDCCSLGTALLLYWLSKPHYYRQYVHKKDASHYERSTWSVLRDIEKSVARGDFPHASIAFDPRKGPGADDWTRDEYADLPRLRDIPDCMWIRTTATGVEPIPRPKPKRARP